MYNRTRMCYTNALKHAKHKPYILIFKNLSNMCLQLLLLSQSVCGTICLWLLCSFSSYSPFSSTQPVSFPLISTYHSGLRNLKCFLKKSKTYFNAWSFHPQSALLFIPNHILNLLITVSSNLDLPSIYLWLCQR